MPDIALYQVDAFTDRLFGGNPAAVCLLDNWLPDALMQAIGAENNLSETAFVVAAGDRFAIRWFTPQAEVPLCGHATLASAHVLMNVVDAGRDSVIFDSRSGPLTVRRAGRRLELDFPSRRPEPVEPPRGLAAALGAEPRAVLANGRYVAVFDRAETVRALAPDIPAVARLGQGVVATAPGDVAGIDFVSRYFAPHVGIPEDPVTGGAHCSLIPYWAGRLGRSTLRARQVSARGGDLWCRLAGDRVHMAGDAVLVSSGTLHLPDLAAGTTADLRLPAMAG